MLNNAIYVNKITFAEIKYQQMYVSVSNNVIVPKICSSIRNNGDVSKYKHLDIDGLYAISIFCLNHKYVNIMY